MKFFNLASILLFCCSCTIIPASRTVSIRAEQIFAFQLGTTESEMTRQLGNPSEREESQDHYTLMYRDPNTGVQRLSLNFSKTEKKMLSFAWAPAPDSPELKIENARALFKGANFEEVLSDQTQHHFIVDKRRYVDKSVGITIFYNGSLKTVEGIAKYEPSMRRPARNRTE